ncbi:50S ribosomal protein L24 [uncultured archaeon]|nr:50S ribosomal protein L24 [uncultured archaeon]
MNWSTSWTGSKKPTKQRNYVRNAPLHVRSTLLGSHLSKELRLKLKTRALRARKGDKVKVIRGQHKGKTGTIDRVNTKRMKAFITGVEFIKKDGSKAMYPIHTSNLIILELHADKRRLTQEAKGEQK